MTPRILLRRTWAKSLTVTLWLMSITASSPATAGRHDEDGAAGTGDGTWATKDGAGGGGCRPPQPARAGALNPAHPPTTTPRRENIQTTSHFSPLLKFSTHDPQAGQKSPL